MQTKLTIAIPAYNSENVIVEAIMSAKNQLYPNKEILVIDDCSTDNTAKIAREWGCRVIVNEKNLGIGGNIRRCMEEAKGKYVLYLCADDKFADVNVASDVVTIFDKRADVGVIGRYYYQFIDGYEGAVEVERNKNIFISAINPSGMAFRNRLVPVQNRIFIEMPSMVYEFLSFCNWTMIEYDTVAVRLKPSQNTGCKPTYYKESPYKVLTDFYGKDFTDPLLLIQIKNRCPKRLWGEIWQMLRINPEGNLVKPLFWSSAITAVLIPGFLLKPLSNFYRHRLRRKFVSIKKRDSLYGIHT